MAVLAMDSVTLASVLEVSSTRRYYLLQSSTLSAPLVPTTNPPLSPWTTTEPSYVPGSTNTLYTTDIWVFSDNTFDYLPVQKSSSYEAAKAAYNAAMDNLYIAQQFDEDQTSRGTDLVVNGTGLQGTNRNFTQFDFKANDAPTGAVGSFITKSVGTKTLYSDDFIPIDPGKRYIFSVSVKETASTGASKFYAGFSAFDAFGNVISPFHYYVPRIAQRTTLAADLKAGDTTATLTNGSGWIVSNGYLTVWNYVDPAGRAWPVGTYTRNVKSITAVNGNVVTLSSAWTGATVPAGTVVDNGASGGSYSYCMAAYATAPTSWTRFASSVVTGVTDGTKGVYSRDFPPGCAKIKLLVLAQYTGSAADSRQAFGGFSISDAAGAAQDASDAKDIAVSKNAIRYELTAPSTAVGGASGTTPGDIWHQYVLNTTDRPGNKDVIKSWSSDGSTWTPWVSIISADYINGGVIKASIGLYAYGEILAGEWWGTCARLGTDGFTTKKLGADDVQFTSTSLGNPNGKNRLAIYKEGSTDPTFEVSEDGDVSTYSLQSANDLYIDGRPLLGKSFDPSAPDGWIDPLPDGIIALGDFSPWAGDGRKAIAPNTTPVVAGIGYLTFQMIAGRSYRVMMPYNYVASAVNAGARAQATIRYTWGTGGAKPTSVPNDSSTTVAVDVHNHTANASYESGRLNFIWLTPFNVDTWVTMYISIQAINCTMQPFPAASPIDSWKLTVEDVGPAVPDTADKFITGTPPANPKSNYVSTWTASSSKNYLGTGSPSTMSIDTTRNILRHGYYDGQAGDSRSVWVVAPTTVASTGNDGGKTIAQALSGGAVITKAEIWVQSLHWWNSNGGTLYYRPLGGSSLPSTLTNAQAPTTVVTKKFTSRSQGFWLTVPTSWFSATATGIVYGPTASSNQASYGYFADHAHPTVAYRPKIRLSYTR